MTFYSLGSGSRLRPLIVVPGALGRHGSSVLRTPLSTCSRTPERRDASHPDSSAMPWCSDVFDLISALLRSVEVTMLLCGRAVADCEVLPAYHRCLRRISLRSRSAVRFVSRVDISEFPQPELCRLTRSFLEFLHETRGARYPPAMLLALLSPSMIFCHGAVDTPTGNW